MTHWGRKFFECVLLKPSGKPNFDYGDGHFKFWVLAYFLLLVKCARLKDTPFSFTKKSLTTEV